MSHSDQYFERYEFDAEARTRLQIKLANIRCLKSDAIRATREAKLVLMRHAPADYLDALERLKGDPTGASALIISGMPMPEDVPPTPLVGSGVDLFDSHVAHLFLVGSAALLGHPYVFDVQKQGQFPASIYPIEKLATSTSNAGFLKNLNLHREDLVAPDGATPTFTLLATLRGDPKNEAVTYLADCRAYLSDLDPQTQHQLTQPNFTTAASESLANGGLDDVDAPVMLGEGVDLPESFVDFDTTVCATPKAQAALDEVRQAASQSASAIKLQAGDALIMCQRRTIHGRGLYEPDFSTDPGQRRWLLRVGVLADAYAVRDRMPGGYRIAEASVGQIRNRIVASSAGLSLPVTRDEVCVSGIRRSVAAYDRAKSAGVFDSANLPDMPRLTLAMAVALGMIDGSVLPRATLYYRQQVALYFVYHELQEVLLAWSPANGPVPCLCLTELDRALSADLPTLAGLIQLLTFTDYQGGHKHGS